MNRTRQACVAMSFVFALGCDAEERPHRLLDDHLDARPSLLPQSAPLPGTVTPIVFVPNDQDVPESEMQQIQAAFDDVEAWYDDRLGDMHLQWGAVQVVRGEHEADWYLRDNNIWNHGPEEVKRGLGYSPWDDGHVVLLAGRGLLGWAGGAGNGNAGFAVTGLESLVDNDACAPEWWCNPDMWRGTAIHELGHALTLPHSEPPSIMDFHGDWRNKVLIETAAFPEVTTVRGLRFVEMDRDSGGGGEPEPGPGEPEPDPSGGGGGDECADLGYAGRCDGSTLVWCEDGRVQSYDCANADMTCAWQDDTIGNNCVKASGDCGDVDYYGRCDGTTLVWCESGSLRSYECANNGQSCGWEDDTVGNNCL